MHASEHESRWLRELAARDTSGAEPWVELEWGTTSDEDTAPTTQHSDKPCQYVSKAGAVAEPPPPPMQLHHLGSRHAFCGVQAGLEKHLLSLLHEAAAAAALPDALPASGSSGGRRGGGVAKAAQVSTRGTFYPRPVKSWGGRQHWVR
jgi:hypothetical protein